MRPQRLGPRGALPLKHNGSMAFLQASTDPVAATPAPGMQAQALLVCESCDAVFQRPLLQSHDIVRCRRCGATLDRGRGLSLQGQLALTVAAAVVFAIASFSPIVTLEFRGAASVASLMDATRLTWQAGEHLVAVLSFFTAFVFPLAVIALRLGVLVSLLAPPVLQQPAPSPRPSASVPWVARPLVVALRALRWGMVEVFMLGILVAVVRSAGVTDIVLGAGLFAYATLTVLLTALQATGLHALWEHVPLSQPAEASR
jgi:paraquat-inducible protein A